MNSLIPPCTIQAYRETDYRVSGDLPLVLRINEFNKPLSALYKVNRANCCCYITACNPLSHIINNASNADHQSQLATDIQNRGLTFFKGIGQHPSGEWPGEPSFLVLGIALEAAKSLGNKYEQNAIVWCGADAVPQLVLLR